MKKRDLVDMLADRFNEIGVPHPDFMPDEAIIDMCEGLKAGKTLCIIQGRDEGGALHMEFRMLKGKRNA